MNFMRFFLNALSYPSHTTSKISLLLQESTDIEKGISIEEKPSAESHDTWNFHSSTEVMINRHY